MSTIRSDASNSSSIESVDYKRDEKEGDLPIAKASSKSIATDTLKETQTLVSVINSQTELTEDLCKAIIRQSSNITAAVDNLLKDRSDASSELAKELTSLEGKLFSKLPPCQITVTDSETPISLPAQLVYKMHTIKNIITIQKHLIQFTFQILPRVILMISLHFL